MSPVDSPQGKAKCSGSRSFGALPKLCNPVQIAIVHQNRLPVLSLNFLPLISQYIYGEQFFYRNFQHCYAAEGIYLVLVSRPYKSTITKEDGAPLVVRQVSSVLLFWYLCVYCCSNVHSIFYSLLRWELWLHSRIELIGCTPIIKVQYGNAMGIHSTPTKK